MTSYRAAVPADAPALVDLLSAMAGECALPWQSVDWPGVCRAIDRVLSEGYAATAWRDGRLVGSVGVVEGPLSWWTADRCVGDLWTYVRPEARGCGGRLRRMAGEHARARGLPYLAGTVGAQLTPERATRLAARPGVWGVLHLHER